MGARLVENITHDKPYLWVSYTKGGTEQKQKWELIYGTLQHERSTINIH